jgi:hypothetical protein
MSRLQIKIQNAFNNTVIPPEYIFTDLSFVKICCYGRMCLRTCMISHNSLRFWTPTLYHRDRYSGQWSSLYDLKLSRLQYTVKSYGTSSRVHVELLLDVSGTASVSIIRSRLNTFLRTILRPRTVLPWIDPFHFSFELLTLSSPVYFPTILSSSRLRKVVPVPK